MNETENDNRLDRSFVLVINTCGNTNTNFFMLCSKVYEYSTPLKIHMEHNHGGLVQIIFLSFHG